MKTYAEGHKGWRVLVLSLAVAFAWPTTTMGGPFEQEFDPPSGRGPIVLLLSGASGPNSVKSQAARVTQLGYYVVLLDGRDFFRPYGKSPEEDLRRVIERAQVSPKALPGKVAVIGFSRGGGAALTFAAPMRDLVSTIVAYYPVTIFVSNMRDFVGQFQVPILVMAGELDSWCPIESLRAMEAAAQEGRKPFELVVYPTRPWRTPLQSREILITPNTTLKPGSAPPRCSVSITRCVNWSPLLQRPNTRRA